MTELEKEMAQHFYGFGCWDAPYWFIGPEQGQGKDENEKLEPRLDAWSRCGKPDLADLRTFHDQLRPGMHRKLQATWKKLILLLLEYKGEPADVDSRRTYQVDRLGRFEGETCLIELSGLPAHSSRTLREREEFRHERMAHIGGKLKTKLEAKSSGFVVVYGKSNKQTFKAVVGASLEPEKVMRVGRTAVVLTTHPNTRGTLNTYWSNLGRSLRPLNNHFE